jgi:hypothetical protein
VLELHRFLQDLADQAQASGDDLVDITSDTPSERSTDNIITLLGTYNIDDDMAEHLYGGSITQEGGDTVYSGLRVLGAVNDTDTQLMVIQDNGLYQFTTSPAAPFWGDQSTGGYNGNSTAGILMRIMVKSRVNGADINNKRIRVQARQWGDTYDFFDVALGLGESVAAISTTPDAQNTTLQATVTAYTDVLNSGGTANAPTGGYQTIDLNNGNGPQPYYSKWTFGAQNLKALWEYTKDLSGNGSTKTIDGLSGELFLGITHEIDFDNDAGAFTERETVVWGTRITYKTLVSGPFTPGNYVTIGASGAAGRVLYDDGVDQLTVALDSLTITILDNDVITEYPGPGAGATSTTAAVDTTVLDNDKAGGTGLLLALDDQGATGTMWIQLLTGVAPVNNLQLHGVTSDNTADVVGTPVARTVPKIFTGSFTGTYISAFGVGIDGDDLTANDTIQDLNGVTQTPPNNVTFTVTGLVSGEDRVLVGPRSGAALNKAQDTLNGTLSSPTTLTINVNTAIPSDTPTSGDVRVELDTGVYREQPYSSYSGSAYTIPSTDYSGANQATDGNNIFIAYIDELAASSQASFTSVYSGSPRDLFVRVRDGGATPIKTFESTAAQLTGTGGTVAAIRTTDV